MLREATSGTMSVLLARAMLRDPHWALRAAHELGVPVEFPRGWHPLRGAPGTAMQVARTVLFLASDAADHITGTEIWIDGGESLIGIHG